VNERGEVERSRGLTIFVWTSWVPLGAFVAANLYVDEFEGWGQWAAAPVLLGPVLLSAVFVVIGTGLVLREQPRRGVQPFTWAALALSSAPCLWFLWRLIVTM
jgi:hypothetical protein